MEPTQTNGLSEREISAHAATFIHLTAKYASLWHKKYGGMVDYDDLQSAAGLALLRALHSYQHNGGATLRTWVSRTMFNTCRATARHLYSKARGSKEKSWPSHRDDGSPVEYGDLKNKLDAERLEDISVGRRVRSLAMAELKNDDREVFRLKFIDELNDVEIADKLHISTQAVNVRKHRVIHRVRTLVKDIPEFMAHDRFGIVRTATQRRPSHKPRFKRVCYRPRQGCSVQYRWVEAGS